MVCSAKPTNNYSDKLDASPIAEIWGYDLFVLRLGQYLADIGCIKVKDIKRVRRIFSSPNNNNNNYYYYYYYYYYYHYYCTACKAGVARTKMSAVHNLFTINNFQAPSWVFEQFFVMLFSESAPLWCYPLFLKFSICLLPVPECSHNNNLFI